jgi:hypothetical protein
VVLYGSIKTPGAKRKMRFVRKAKRFRAFKTYYLTKENITEPFRHHRFLTQAKILDV